ncbi:MAG: zinc ribbon domain-containing protein [Myxococcota bacterium]
MTELDAKVADQEQRHRLERMSALAGQSEGQMLAMQAADLAGKEHGGAFAEALGKLADGEQARRERERADAAAAASAEALRDLAKASIEAGAKVASAKAAAPAAVVCPGCGATLSPGTRFCGGCGTATV